MTVQARRPQVLFLHIGWARDYAGAVDDPPQGEFGYVRARTGPTGESLNFKAYGQRCYGYAPHQSISLHRLGAASSAEFEDHVLVIFTATNPDGTGRFIVGWYQDARVHAVMQNTPFGRTPPDFIVEANVVDCYLVPVDDRTFFVPSMIKGWPGIANAFYPGEQLSEHDLDTLSSYIDGSPSIGFAGTQEEPVGAAGGKIFSERS